MEEEMTGIQIAMIIIGIILIIVSYIISEKITSSKESVLDEEVAQQEMIRIRSIVDATLKNASSDILDKTEDAMSKMSNEKIIALHEYSEQVFEKIEHNHNEVVFLYDMLNAKEKEVKGMLLDINHMKKKVEDAKETSSIKSEDKEKKNNKKSQPKSQQDDLVKAVSDKEKKAPKKVEKNVSEKKTSIEVEELINMDDYNEFVEQNYNEQILKLYEAGKSVIEISKTLGIGQGEVKLVINLYNGVNGK